MLAVALIVVFVAGLVLLVPSYLAAIALIYCGQIHWDGRPTRRVAPGPRPVPDQAEASRQPGSANRC